MSKLKIRHGIGEITALMPANIIFGVAPGASVPLEWNNWTLANGFFLKGTDSDSLVNTFVQTDIISYSSASSGRHGGNDTYMFDWGLYNNPDSGQSNYYPSGDTASNKGQHSHVLTVDYEPAAFNLRLVQAQQDTYLFPGAICFSVVAQPDHQPYADNVGMLKAGNTTETTPAAGSPSVANANFSHNHFQNVFFQGQSITNADMYEDMDNYSNSHSHNWSPSFTHNVRHALMRVYQIVNISRTNNIVGIWADSGVPDGWEVVAELIDNYLKFSTLGDGSVSGNNTVDVSGNTEPFNHLHTVRNSRPGAFAWYARSGHRNNHSHFHNGSRSGIAFEPERYYVKFIRKLP